MQTNRAPLTIWDDPDFPIIAARLTEVRNVLLRYGEAYDGGEPRLVIMVANAYLRKSLRAPRGRVRR